MQIDVDFEVFKALTALRNNENHSYNDVIREVLGLDSIVEPESHLSPFSAAADALARPFGFQGFSSRGIHLPDGTLLRARYKNREFRARIEQGSWIDADGRQHMSPSAAAAAITGTNVNGLRFWEAQRPSDTNWQRLELLRQS
jgi:hypothetical protein